MVLEYSAVPGRRVARGGGKRACSESPTGRVWAADGGRALVSSATGIEERLRHGRKHVCTGGRGSVMRAVSVAVWGPLLPVGSTASASGIDSDIVLALVAFRTAPASAAAV